MSQGRVWRPDVPQELAKIACLGEAEVLHELSTSRQGLSGDEVELRRQEHGPNRVAHEARRPLGKELLGRLANPLNVLLLLLAAGSVLLHDTRSALLISLMVVLSVWLATVQERRASRAAEELRAMVHTTAAVTRQQPGADIGAVAEIPIEQLVPGDIVHLAAGDMIPADLRVISAKDLYINQAAMTGESMPVEKGAEAQAARAGSPGELRNICLMGTDVVSGSATAVVVLTGRHACFGALADSIAADRTPTSFDRGAERFAWLMIRFILVMAPLVFLINGLTKGNWIEALLFATAVAVGLTPEMLPMIVTVNLAKGALAMSRKQVIVKRLGSIQNLGAMDVLCTDKTGTLTEDRIILRKAVDLTGAPSEEVLEHAYLNSHYQSGLRSLLDVAVLGHPQAPELARWAAAWHKLDEVPFDFERRRMSVAVAGAGRRLLICKGAVEELFAVSQHGRAGGTAFPLDPTHLVQLRATADALNADGFRVIAVGIKELPPTQDTVSVRDESDLTLLGYIAFLDPPKASAGTAIAALARHGVAVKVLTGDNEIVTRKICQEVGLHAGRVVLGSELTHLTEDELGTLVEETQVFAKLSPGQKAQVLKALQRRGHVTGFLGDGINDGAALKAADVGISVDSAVDIAKESADIILLEKSLTVLDDGVMEGRRVFGNVLKYIRMGASSNFGNMLSVLGASAWLPFLPMTPVQVLANNLLYDLSQTAIPTDNVDEEYIASPRRWEIGNIGRYMLFIGPVSSLFDYATYFTMYFLFGARDVQGAQLFQTGWFVESVVSQTLIIHVIRTRHVAFLESRASTALLTTTLLVSLAGLWLPYSPLASALGLVPLPALYWPILGAMVVAYLALTHLTKTWFHHRFGLG
jgi:Mg2+-importing ATPase